MHIRVQTGIHFCVSWGTDAWAGKNNLPPVTQKEGTPPPPPLMMHLSQWG